MDGIQLNITTTRSLKRKNSHKPPNDAKKGKNPEPQTLTGTDSHPPGENRNRIAVENALTPPPEYENSPMKEPAHGSRPIFNAVNFVNMDQASQAAGEGDVTTPKETLFSADTFQSLSLHPHLVKNILDKFGFSKMTYVQKLAIPVVQKGVDVLVKSQTGSGKTLVYAVPILNHLGTLDPPISRSDGVHCLVVLPTRELAVQSFDVFYKLRQSFIKITPGCLCGGEKKKSEKARIRKGINILVSTPGRLLDHLKTSANLPLSLSRLQYLVIDEADRLLESGFEHQVDEILQIVKENTNGKFWQTILLSATLTPAVERLVSLSLRNPEYIDVQAVSSASGANAGSSDGFLSEPLLAIPEQLKQYYVVTPTKLKLAALSAFLVRKRNNKVVIFFPTQDIVEFVFSLFENVFEKLIPLLESSASRKIVDKTETAVKTKLFRLHGEMGQSERSDVFRRFSQSDSGFLFSTDVAARGLDLPSIKWVVQFQAPESPAVYVHRVGRTARAGRCGSSILFLIPNETPYVKMMRQDYGMNLKSVRFSSITSPDESKKLANSPKQDRGLIQVIFDVQHLLDEAVNSDKSLSEMARKGYISFVRAYATYRHDQRSIFNVRNGLHFGHVARCFGMKNETPTEINNILRRNNDPPKRQFGRNDRNNNNNSYSSNRPVDLSYRPPPDANGSAGSTVGSYPTWKGSSFDRQSSGRDFTVRPSSTTDNRADNRRGTKVLSGVRSSSTYQVAMQRCSEFASGL